MVHEVSCFRGVEIAQSVSKHAKAAGRISEVSFFDSRYEQDIFSPPKRPDRSRSPSTPLMQCI